MKAMTTFSTYAELNAPILAFLTQKPAADRVEKETVTASYKLRPPKYSMAVSSTVKPKYMPHSHIAVVWVLGVSFPFTGPTDSAPMRWKVPAPAPSAGRKATKRTTIPMPPSQLVMLLQKRMLLKLPSISVIVVAPVVVKPLIISK